MTAGPTAPARAAAAVAPSLPRRRAAPRGAPQAGTGARARVIAGRVRWYATKWFRQMLFVMAHPTEAFWELKRTGDWMSVPVLLLLAIASRMLVMSFMSFHYIFQGVERTNWNFERIMQTLTSSTTLGMTNFIYNANPEDTSIIQEGLRILVPFITWVLAHYAISMIFYGEGGLRDIAVSAAFSLTPYIFFAWPASLILTNITTLAERQLYFGVSWVVNLWVFWLFVTHQRVIHDFTFKRTVFVYALSLITMVIIWALMAMLWALTVNTYEFFYEIFYEMTTR
ncbi:MAG TPA: YIP1 family protein [Chloroflexota bacterium]|nr:YIP1 family protein [Chloroflexota bacterium]